MAEERSPDDEEALDAYSTVVTRVASAVLPSVASLTVRTSRGDGSGSASVITPDGYLLTSAHVVAGADEAEAVFTDGTSVKVDVVGRDVLSDLAVLKARDAVPAPVAMGRARTCGWASSWWQSAIRSASRAASPQASCPGPAGRRAGRA